MDSINACEMIGGLDRMRVLMSPQTLERLQDIYFQPFFDLLYQARAVHMAHWKKDEVQLCALLSIKTGGCSEDCAYCAQSARYSTAITAEKLMSPEAVLEVAKEARANGATRFCMGAAWKGVRENTKQFESVIDIIREVSKLDMEVDVLQSLTVYGQYQRLRDDRGA